MSDINYNALPEKTTPSVSWDKVIITDSEDWNIVKIQEALQFKWPQGDIWNTWVWIASITLISTVWKIKTYRITYTDTTTFDFIVTDWADWTWTWDMLKSENLSWLANYTTARSNLSVYSTTEVDNKFNLVSITTDLNTIVTNWFYCWQSGTSHLPEAWVKTRVRVNVDPSNSDNIMQEALTTTTWVSYYRITTNGGSSWTAWARIKATDETKALDTAVVKLTWDQTIAWVKTFSSSPIVPTPTTDMQVATKKYVDDNAWSWSVTTLDTLEITWTQYLWVVSNYRVGQSWTLAKFSAYTEIAPTWANFIVVLKVNWTTQATATITVWNTSNVTTTFSDTTLTEWDLITYEITQIGSTVAWANLTLVLNLS